MGANDGDGIGLVEYIMNAKGSEPLDFKNLGLNKDATKEEVLIYRSRGSVLDNGTIVSARDVGNAAAGTVAKNNGLSVGYALMEFDALQTWQERGSRTFSDFASNGFSREAKVSRNAQLEGYKKGSNFGKKIP